jgi:hypothetical protein
MPYAVEDAPNNITDSVPHLGDLQHVSTVAKGPRLGDLQPVSTVAKGTLEALQGFSPPPKDGVFTYSSASKTRWMLIISEYASL